MAYTIKDFLEIRIASPSGFSPDASKVLIATNLTGTMQLYRRSREQDELVQITDFEEPVSGSYLPTSDEILLHMDEGGNERSQIYLMDDAGENLRKVVFEPDFINVVGGVTRDSETIAYRSNQRNGVDFDIYVRDLKTGEERCVFDWGGMCSAAGFSPNGRLVAVARPGEASSMDNDIYLVDLITEEVHHVTPHDDDSSFSGPSWMPDGRSFFFSTDHDREFRGIARYDMAETSWKYVIEDEWDLGCKVDWPGKRLLVSTNREGSFLLSIRDPQSLRALAEVPFPVEGVRFGQMVEPMFSRDGRFVAYFFTSSSEPGDAWLYDTQTQDTTRLTDSPKSVTKDAFVEPELHRFETFDGESIPIFLYLPEGSRSEPVPVVVSVHGGPEGQFVPSFNPTLQYLVNRGYAVAAPNVRGSTGYGKRYHHLDDIRKRLDAVEDLAFLHRWLKSVAAVDADRAALMGGSYGGFMVLAGLVFQPELWAAGVDIVGISSFVTFLENTSAWRRKFREREYGSLENDREFLEKASPITHVDKMRAPLFIIHGANDPRVPLSEAEQIHKVLTEKGVPAELLVYHDEGHGLAKLRNRLDAYPKAAGFLDRILVP